MLFANLGWIFNCFWHFFLICNLLSLSAQENSNVKNTCQDNFHCGNLSSLSFPFFNSSNPHDCGLWMVDCEAHPSPKVALQFPAEQWFEAKAINSSIIKLHDPLLHQLLSKKSCVLFYYDIRLPKSPSISYSILQNITMYRCTKNHETSQNITDILEGYRNYNKCDDKNYTIYHQNPQHPAPAVNFNGIVQSNCAAVTLPMVSWDNDSGDSDLFQLLTADFDLQWHLSDDCNSCHKARHMCRTDWSADSRCVYPEKGIMIGRAGKKNLKVILGAVISVVACIIFVVVMLLIWHRKKGINGFLHFLSRNTSEPSSKPDLEGGSVYFGVPVFSYSELEEATSSFDSSKELGDGGFGTVYFGKLRDGREVAVKRLYEHNFKRMEQFINEIEILTRLRHRNLVTLYGCTSKRSRELLLVYEYIPNGTVADHLHGDRAKDKYLTWPHRLNIAIETADALAYLHKSDIIHRDVKTNNILLDLNFCVKVADFGLSRLFPTDVTHISTAPQGTPGYVDPEYHQCYQLTDKSDVYSFGVVLIELISSMPAVDISRHRHEINLANLAINRIQKCAFDELIDPSLGYKSDTEVMRMTTSVAELAFRCLQLEKDMRPKMEEVLETLKEIQKCNDILVDNTTETNEKAIESKRAIVPSPESEDVVLLKNAKFLASPNSVADVWISGSTTTSTSR